MPSSLLRATLRTATLAVAATLLMAGTSFSADVYLAARSFSKPLPGGAPPVPVWGFQVCTDNTYSTCSAPAVLGGPAIEQTAGTALTIELKNFLPTPVSLVIPGQPGGGVQSPVKVGGRVQSFASEAPGNGGTATYSWNLRAGTYLFQSGTHPSIQVAMGLYGALVVRVAGVPPRAYPSVTYDADPVLLFSEIDPVQNARVAELATLAAPGLISPADYPSTINYSPAYFLINGKPFDRTAPPSDWRINAGTPPPGATEWRVLLRLVNAGLRSHTPVPVGLEMQLLAEDGNLYPDQKRQAAVLLAAGKTLDALVSVPPSDASYPVFDRMLDLTNASQPEGGMLAYLTVGAGSGPPPPYTGLVAVNDSYDVDEDAINFAGNVLLNDSGKTPLTTVQVLNPPTSGTLALNPDGTFTYTPDRNFSGEDSFNYIASNSPTESSIAAVVLSVSFVNDPPTAAADGPYVNNVGGTISVPAPGVLGNDQDVDGDALTAVLEGTAPPGLTLNENGSFSVTGATGTFTFSYRAKDSHNVLSGPDPVTVSVTILPVNTTISLNVHGPDPADIVSSYRWLVEEDTTWHPDPNVIVPVADSLATNFHKSYMPVVAQGCVGAECSEQVPFKQTTGQGGVALNPAKHYFVSVLPNDASTGTGHTLGGAPIRPGATSVDVIVNRQPIPTAQISVFVFEDRQPTNGAPDAVEQGLGGFQITLEDPAGRYGQAGGTMSQDAFGNMLTNALPCAPPSPQPGVIVTCPDGRAFIQNLAPGKYGVIVTPPAGAPFRWSQTSTIEGTRVIDAWVKAGEPPFFQEFGPPGFHVFVGFISPDRLGAPGGTNTVTGTITNMHMSRPPVQTLWDSNSRDALAHTTAWVGLNSAGGLGPNLVAVKTAADGSFTVPNVPDGSYQLVVWDEYLDQIIAYRALTLPGEGNLGNVPVFNWFARLETWAFLDQNRNGKRDPGEGPVAEQAVNLRFRDGTIYQFSTTDTEGYFSFDEMFPFFHWLIAEIDFTRYLPTGVTVTVDAGGDVSSAPPPFTGVLNPQVQAGGATSRTETGPVLLQAVQGFLGQTSVLEWGKAPYRPGENGGIAGIVYYASTRSENDPRLAVGDPWEPGIPRVKVRLYRQVSTAAGGAGLVLVDEVLTDSWDDSLPANCPGDPADPMYFSGRCYDGIRNFNQVRPGVFDGGYAFTELAPGVPLPPGKYVVEVVPPPGYELVKEEDKNVEIGDAFLAPPAMLLPNLGMVAILPDQAMVAAAVAPEPALIKPPCVGASRAVPHFLSLFPTDLAPFADTPRPLCDRKEVVLADQSQAAADFFLFTSTPIAGHHAGMILNDLAQEFNPASPQFGEKFAPPFVPVAFRDFNGREIARLYSDQWGRYNGLVPSTFTANVPQPSGYSPAMLISCMNDPGPVLGPGGQLIRDPQYNPSYSNFCYTFQYMPGTTTYLDTPVLPTAAFASGYNPVDCAFPDATPVVKQVDGDGVGPFLNPGTGNMTLWIYSQGMTNVPNPAYEGPGTASAKTIVRDYSFGSVQGVVRLGGVPLSVTSWTPDRIVAQVPRTATTGQLIITRGDNGLASTITSVTVTVANENPIRVAPGGSVQTAIDNAAPGSLILVPPGNYEELLVLWKPVRLQGAGAGSTLINAAKFPTEKLVAWRLKIDALFAGDPADRQVDPLPGQPIGGVGLGATLGTEEGAGITVLGKNYTGVGPNSDSDFLSYPSRIDGFTITGGDSGGGIFVNGWAHGLEIANNNIFGNAGQYHGGVRIGRPFLAALTGPGPFGFNRNLNVHHNAITQNGGLAGAGGGLSLCTGTDNYTVNWNFVCGNFTTGDGGGIGHFGLSSNGLIAHNQVLFNQSFNQGLNRSGGGVFVGGEPPAVGTLLTFGAGNVTIDANLISGNDAGAGHGGGIRTQQVNGQENSPWYQVAITNNLLTNNVAGWSGAGISLQDTINARIVNNTVVNNDSTSTVGNTFTAGPNTSVPQPAGISSELHSPGLAALLPGGQPRFSNPVLFNNIVWHNRSFYYDGSAATARLIPALTQTFLGDCPSGATYWDLGVLGQPRLNPARRLNPSYSILTSTAGYSFTNSSTPPILVSPYCNGPRTLRLVPGVTTLQPLPALDEGGNWIEVRWGPLTQLGDYHLGANTTSGILAGSPPIDFDGDSRTSPVDRGADEKSTPRMPTNLAAVAAVGPPRITLTWVHSFPGETYFSIQRALNASFTQSPTFFPAPQNATTYLDSTVVLDTTYFYRVAACNAVGCSAYSNIASATPVLPNLPPDSMITSPGGDVTIFAGQSVTFTGVGTDPDNNLPLTYLWNFGGGATVPDPTQADQGAVQFNTLGTFTVTFTVTDARGMPDPSPAAVQVTVLPPGTIIPGRIFTTGFEENNLTATMWTSASGATASIQNSVVRSGNYALRLRGQATRPALVRDFAAPVNSGSYFFRFYLLVAQFPANGQLARVFRFATTGGTNSAIIELRGSDHRLQVLGASTAVGTAVLQASTWYRVELRDTLSLTGTLELRVDGVQDALLNTNTLPANPQRVTFGGATAAQTFDVYLDDIAINHSSGNWQNSWPGAGNIAMVEPAADTAVAWSRNGSFPAATNFGGVDDLPGAPNNNTDFNADSSTTNQDRFAISPLPGAIPAAAQMVLMDVYARGGSNGTSARSFSFQAWDNLGTLSAGPAFNCAVNGWRIGSVGPLNEHQVVPLTGRSKAATQSYSIGYKSTTGAGVPKRVTALWANVEWTEVTNAAPVVTIDTPATDQTINAGQSVSFTSTATDPDGDPLTSSWDFNGDGISDSSLEDPGAVAFHSPGSFLVTLTVRDPLGAPGTATRTINVLGPNVAPNSIIDQPATDVVVVPGQAVSFAGHGVDSPGETLSYLWAFPSGNPGSSTSAGPVNVVFPVGLWTVTFTVSDDRGGVDLTPATRRVRVDQAPNGSIVSPVGNQVITAGQALNFQGGYTDPDSDPATYLWTFGDATIPQSTAQNPGNITFLNPGTYTVTLLVTDLWGISDPTPATIQVTVNPAGQQASGRIFTTGFEENNLYNTMWTSSFGSTVSVQTAVKHSGNYALRLSASSSLPEIWRDLSAPVTSGTYFFRFYLNVGALPFSNARVFRLQSTAGSVSATIDLRPDGRLRIVAGTTVVGTKVLALNTWYLVELRTLLSPSAGAVELRVDGVQDAIANNVSTVSTNVQRITFGGGTNINNYNFYIDDVAINESSGTWQNSWPGPGNIALVEPSADTAVSWARSGSTPAATNFGGVDDLPGAPNNATDYNSDTTITNQDRFALSTLPAEVPGTAQMVLMDVYAVGGSNATGTRDFLFQVWDDVGTIFIGPSFSCSINGWRMGSIGPNNEHQAVNLTGKTKAATQSYSIGYKASTGAGAAKRVTALWANVEWR